MPEEQNLPANESACCASAMRKASRRLTQLYDDALARSGLRSTQYTILAELNLRSHKPPTLQELANALVMDRSALGHTLRPLERDGLLVLQQSGEDRRRRHVLMTAEGTAKFREAKQFWQAAQDRFQDVFGASNAQQLRSILLGIAYDVRLAPLRV